MPDFIELHDTDEFDRFWEDNGGEDSFGISKDDAFALACNCEWIVGGGAAPQFRVGFID